MAPGDNMFVGNHHINHTFLNSKNPSSEVADQHPLYLSLKLTSEPPSLEDNDEFSDAALLTVHNYFHKLSISLTDKHPAILKKIPDHSYGTEGGMWYVFAYITSALCALVNLQFGGQVVKRKAIFSQKSTHEAYHQW
ncbi:hypothetical protein PSTT_05957 [Puccinia striiformis]|uniref:Uncharacterized protein n=1 Tax=Puccinia striiformis TaxID=27350 RepID=A0A2S4VM08_9BASI|nr:hypothetical protein PSTT_05957 [Puccinia striiformis]